MLLTVPQKPIANYLINGSNRSSHQKYRIINIFIIILQNKSDKRVLGLKSQPLVLKMSTLLSLL